MTILKTFFLNNPVIFIFLSIILSNLLTYFDGFICFPQLCLTDAKSFNIEEICIKQVYTKGVYIKDVLACTRNINIEDISTKNTSIKDENTSGICLDNIYTKASICLNDTYIKVGTNICDIYIGDANINIACISDTYAKKSCTCNVHTSII